MTEKKKESSIDCRPKESRPYKKERQQFKSLLLANPNYFGNLEKSLLQPKVKITGNTYYEEIGCVGYQPQFERLEAVIYVYQPSGYGGNICSAGTPEYVRFYLSFDGGGTWDDQGMSNFTAYDIPEGTRGEGRLEYAIAREVDPPRRWCKVQNTILARAILSWNIEPPANQPNWVPVWGNVHDTNILVDPFKLKIQLNDFLESLEMKPDLPFAKSLDTTQELTLSQPKALGLNELAKLYADKKVETHRFGFPTVHKLINQPDLGETLEAAGPAGVFADIPDFNLEDILDKLEPVDGNISYEELECIGLDNVRDELVGVIRVKLPAGYSGNPCTAGSIEYVTFWGDFDDDGTYEECLGTASVQVYDISQIPPEGLEYAVHLPTYLHDRRKECKDGPVVVNIRAILSWQVAPPCNNPDFVPVWGNREETTVHLRPGPTIEQGDFTPFLYSLCNRAVCSIDQTTGWATGDRPFGSSIRIEGEIPAAMTLSTPDTLKYKVYVQALNDLGVPIGVEQPLNNSFTVTLHEGTGLATAISYPMMQQIDPVDGFYTYREYGNGSTLPWRRVSSPNRMLASWNTSSAETGLWKIRIEALDTLTNTLYLAGTTTCILDGTTRQDVKVRLDQTPPVAALAITGFSRDGGPVQPAVDCGTFQVGDVIHGTYSGTDAPDDHFRVLTLTLEPAAAANGATPSPSSRSYPTVLGAGESSSWTLDTAGMDPCGYTVRLLVRDRTIANCSGYGRWDDEFVGFCLVEVPE